MTRKGKKIDLSCLGTTDPKVKEMIAKGVPPGQFCTIIEEEFPEYEQAACEHVIRGKNNADIILGRDRPASLASGNGGRGATKCGMIDLVVGRLSGIKKCADGRLITGPNFAAGAARVYITQRGDVDKYFALFRGNTNCGSTADPSAVGIKADHTRIIGRRSVKIYAGKGAWQGTGFFGEPNSVGGDIIPQPVIELVAGNYDDIQPAVKGDNLKKALTGIYSMLRGIVGSINSLYMLMLKMSGHTVGHSHGVVALGGGVAFPDPGLMFGSIQQLVKAVCGSIDAMLKQFNGWITQIGAIGIGPEKATVPGWDDILSSNVYIT